MAVPSRSWRLPHSALPLLLSTLAFLLYLRTLAPSVATVFDDSLEFHVVIPLLGVPHPPGYPLYTLLGKLWTLLIPLRDPAWRLNLFSALVAALALHILYSLTYRLIPRHSAVAPAVILLALAPTFWSQATIAEVYALHLLFTAAILHLTLRLVHPTGETNSESAESESASQRMDEPPLRHSPLRPFAIRHSLPATCYLLTATLGLSLTHHRMTLLLLPAVAYALWVARGHLPRVPRFWLTALALLLLPQLLYLYIPLIGAHLGSLDGTYVNSWPAFLEWVQARAYRVFLTANPFNVHRGPGDYLRLYLDQMGVVALILALLGLLPTRWRVPRPGNGDSGAAAAPSSAVLLLALAVHLLFVVNYNVVDIDVFFLPILLLTVPLIAAGLARAQDTGRALFRWGKKERPGWPNASHLFPLAWGVALTLGVLAQPAFRTPTRWETLDRSDDWAVYDLGLDIVRQPLPPESIIVGILGETTLVRYFRDVLGYRPDLVVMPADREAARHQAIARGLSEGRAVFITRPLSGAPEQYALDALGPLIRVRPRNQDDRPHPPHRVDAPLAPEVTLAGYGAEKRATHRGPVLRLTLYWDVLEQPREDYKVSARLLRPDGTVAQAVDNVPVHNTYPTPFWSPGERVVDVYDLPLPAGPTPTILLILYRGEDGSEVGRVTFPAPVSRSACLPCTRSPPPGKFNLTATVW